MFFTWEKRNPQESSINGFPQESSIDMTIFIIFSDTLALFSWEQDY